jgi:VIT1/CCC1 family predicted Fe2+/Mn2+ transporter
VHAHDTDVEKHFTGSASVRDVVIGMADGLTVPFALAAGLSAAVSSTKIIVTASLAEIVAAAIAMGLGGYLTARTDQNTTNPRSGASTENLREREVQEVEIIFKSYGLEGEGLRHIVDAITNNRQRWGRFHDAVRTRPRTSRSYAGSYQCSNDCRVLPGRRPDPAGTLHLHVTHGSRVQGVRAVDGPGSCCVRGGQGDG